MRWTWLAVALAGCGSTTKARPPADAARPGPDAGAPATPFLAAVTAADNGLTAACVGGVVAPAIAELAAELDCRQGPVTGFRDATVGGHHVVFLLDAAGDMRGRLDGQPLDKIRLGEAGPVMTAFPPATLAALADPELARLLTLLASVAMINPARRIGFTAAGLDAIRAAWPGQRFDAAAPPVVVVDGDRRRVRLAYQLEGPPGCRELWWSDVWVDRAGALDQLTYRIDYQGASCPTPAPRDPDRGNFFPD